MRRGGNGIWVWELGIGEGEVGILFLLNRLYISRAPIFFLFSPSCERDSRVFLWGLCGCDVSLWRKGGGEVQRGCRFETSGGLLHPFFFFLG